MWKKFNISGIREEFLGWKDVFMNINYEDVNSIWGYIKEFIVEIVKYYVLICCLLVKYIYLWMIIKLRCFSNRKYKFYI